MTDIIMLGAIMAAISAVRAVVLTISLFFFVQAFSLTLPCNYFYFGLGLFLFLMGMAAYHYSNTTKKNY